MPQSFDDPSDLNPEVATALPAEHDERNPPDAEGNAAVGTDRTREAAAAQLNAPSLLMVPEEFAQLLKVSVRTLGRRLDRDELPRPILIGSRRRWLRPMVEEWLAAGAPSGSDWMRMQQTTQPAS